MHLPSFTSHRHISLRYKRQIKTTWKIFQSSKGLKIIYIGRNNNLNHLLVTAWIVFRQRKLKINLNFSSFCLNLHHLFPTKIRGKKWNAKVHHKRSILSKCKYITEFLTSLTNVSSHYILLLHALSRPKTSLPSPCLRGRKQRYSRQNRIRQRGTLRVFLRLLRGRSITWDLSALLRPNWKRSTSYK